MVEVQIKDIRARLNSISEDTLTDDTISAYIQEGYLKAQEYGSYDPAVPATETAQVIQFVTVWASYYSLLIAKVWDKSRIADLTVQKDWEKIRAVLKKKLDDEIDELTGYAGIAIVSTAGFDTRPLDPAADEVRVDDATIE